MIRYEQVLKTSLQDVLKTFWRRLENVLARRLEDVNNTQTDNAEYIDIVMPMHNLIEYSDNYSKTSGSLWQYFKDIPAVNDNSNIVHSNGANATDSFNFKIKMTGQTDDDGEMNNIEIMIALRYLSKF